MCNDYEQHVAWAAYCEAMQMAALKIATRQIDMDLRQADDIRISEPGPVIRRAGDEAELVPMAFGWPSDRGPVFNFRSDGRRFADSNRCLIVASAFFEFTGKKSPKAKHRFTMVGEPVFAIAGLWKPGQGNQPAAFTMLTTQPGTDVAPIHNRQIVVLAPADWRAWLDLTRAEAEILRALPAGSLSVETVRPGSD